jgi:hypothetical protein
MIGLMFVESWMPEKGKGIKVDGSIDYSLSRRVSLTQLRI